MGSSSQSSSWATVLNNSPPWRRQRSGLGDGKLAAIRCHEVFLAFPKVQQPSEKPAAPAADATGEQLSERLQAQPCDGGSITGEPKEPSSFRENGAMAGQKSGIFPWMSVAQVRA